MNVTERLAREIRRVAELYGFQVECNPPGHEDAIAITNAALEEACKAIGSGDAGRMEAAGLQLKTID